MTKIILTTIFTLSASFCNSQTNSSIDTAKDPVIFLKNFYTIYITKMAIGQRPESNDSLVKKYCTSRLLKKIAAHSNPERPNWWDYDPIIKAQDADTATLKTLVIKTNKTPDSYSVSYKWTDYYTKKTGTFIIHLIVEKQKEGFRIADVW
jgi:Protein of unknown function (DUF3828)